MGFTLVEFGLGLLPQSFASEAAFSAKPVPAGELLDGVAEQGVKLPLNDRTGVHGRAVLRSLSMSANDWLMPEKLKRLCAVPVIGILEARWDLGSFAFESRILRPLTWFGLMESRWKDKARLGEPRLYRKTPFDPFLKFNALMEILKAEPMSVDEAAAQSWPRNDVGVVENEPQTTRH